MTFSVEALQGWERKMTITVPAEEFEEKVVSRLRELRNKAHLPGFRPGKAPESAIKKRFGAGVREEVARDMIQPSWLKALEEHSDSDGRDLTPIGLPKIQIDGIEEEGKDLTFTLQFEIYPFIELKEIPNEEIEVVRSSVQETDVDAMMQTLREQNQVWQEVDRKVAEQDKVRIDFEGYLEDKLFEGGSAKGHELIIGKGTMIPGFESGLIGAEKGKPCSLQLTFPQEYGHQELAGKEARFEVTIETIWEGSLPELNEEFAEKLDIKEGGVEALRQDIRENMERELQHRVEVINRERMLKALIKHNPIELPHVMVEKEIQQLRHEMYHRLFGAEHREDEKIPDFPRVLFESEAKHRVHMSLLFSEYVKLHNIEPDAQKVEAMVGVLSTAYEDPAEFRKHYTENRREREKIEGLVLENMVAEKIGEHAILVEKDVPYSEIMHPKKEEQEQKGE